MQILVVDVCDGFGRGWSRERILDIIKDSRVGTYWLVSLVLAVKVAVLSGAATNGLPRNTAVPVLLAVAHSLSRTALTFVHTLPYARADLADGKAKPVAQSMPLGRLVVASILGFLPLVALVVWEQRPDLLWMLVPLVILHLVLGRWFKK